MLTLSKMKSLISPTLSTLAPNLRKPTTTLSSFPHSAQSVLCNFISLRNTEYLHHKLFISSLDLYAPLNPTVLTRCFGSEASQSSSGEIHVIVGPMFAGKTTTLLRRIKSESGNGRNVAVIKSNKDTRYGLDSIVTHDGEKLPCWPLENLSSFRLRIGPDAYHKLDVIGIDEAQFFDDLYDFCCKAADLDGKTLIVAGLDGDYLRRRFGSVLDLVPIADSVMKLQARCELCGKPGLFTLRKTEQTETQLIAGSEVYMPVCRSHYASGRAVKETARAVLEEQKVEYRLFL